MANIIRILPCTPVAMDTITMAAVGPTPLPEPAAIEGRSSLAAVATAVVFSKARLRRRRATSVRKSSMQDGEDVLDGGVPEASPNHLQSPVTGSRARVRRKQWSTQRERGSSVVSEETSQAVPDQTREVGGEGVTAGEQPVGGMEDERAPVREEGSDDRGSAGVSNELEHQYGTAGE